MNGHELSVNNTQTIILKNRCFEIQHLSGICLETFDANIYKHVEHITILINMLKEDQPN